MRRRRSDGRAEESSPPATDTNTWLVVTKGQMDTGGGEKLERQLVSDVFSVRKENIKCLVNERFDEKWKIEI